MGIVTCPVPRITFLAAPKPFVGRVATAQQNAVESWTRLVPRPEVLLFGDEEGVGACAESLGVAHAPFVERNQYGTPLLSDLMAQGERRASDGLICFANADIVFLQDFMDTAKRVYSQRERFLLVSRTRRLQVDERLAFDVETLAKLRDRVRTAPLRHPTAIDYFVFPKGLFGSLPKFAIGRAAYDNWLLWKASTLSVPVIDATASITAIHQEHGYEHVAGGLEWTRAGPEAKRNQELAGGDVGFRTLRDASHLLVRGRVVRNPKSIGRAATRITELRHHASRALHAITR
jgi:hypothetical protein